MSISRYADLFRTESREHVATINDLLLALEADPGDVEHVEGLFRAVHTIKGMAATMGFTALTALAHEMESVLDLWRRDELAGDGDLLDLLFRATDAIEIGIEAGGEDASLDVEPLLAALRQVAGGRKLRFPLPRVGPLPLAEVDHVADAPPTDGAAVGASSRLRVRLVVETESGLPGVRAVMALRSARELGRIEELEPAEEALYEDAFSGELRFSLLTDASADEVRTLLASVGEIAAVTVDIADAPVRARGQPASEDEGAEAAAPSRAAQPADRPSDRHIRIDAERLDGVMDRIGELVILRDRLARVTGGVKNEELTEPVEQMARLVGELREEIMRMRMVPVGDVFARFSRLVRDGSQRFGKRVDFVITGREIELDRSLLDRIGDPLVHLLRNAIDHGIETPEERAAAGKPEAARLRLSAERERTRVTIRVEDDGRGIDRARVLDKAVAQGLVTRSGARDLADEDIFALITRPGFSTAGQVTDVSGRGVGLDVVATRVRALGGTLEIASREGQGTTFTLRLPLTVGILRALLVRAGADTYALPIAHVVETIEFGASDVDEIGGRRVVLLRGEPLNLVRLRDVLRLGAASEVPDPVAAVIVEVGEECIGLEVDALVGQQEIVIKPFDGTRDTLPVFSGATILSDGRPALILDAAGLLQHGRAVAAGQSPVLAR